MKKKRVSFSKLYLVIVMLITYLPIAMVVVFSFNDSKLPVAWKGFTWKWYQELFHDAAMIEALKNSLILGFISCAMAAVIGTLGAIGMARVNYKRGWWESINHWKKQPGIWELHHPAFSGTSRCPLYCLQ